MTCVAVLALLGVGAQVPQAPPIETPGSFTLFGKQVAAHAPPLGQADYPSAVKSWPGWGPLTGKPATPFLVDGDWTPVLSAPTATKPDPTAVPWRVKVILIPSVDFVSPDASGNFVERRTGIYGPTRERIAQGLALAAATLQAETEGRLAVTYDTTEDSALYEESSAEGAALGAKALAAYVTPRINGGSFEANDKLYHGPYHLCLVIHAGLSHPSQCEASGTPVFGVPAPVYDTAVSAYAAAFLQDFRYAARVWSMRHGYKPAQPEGPVAPLENVFGDQPLDQVVADAGLGSVSGADLVQAHKAAPYLASVRFGARVQVESPVSANTQLAIVQDGEMGAVLSARIGGDFASGGFGLALPGGLSQAATSPNHILVFNVRTGSPDALGVGVTGGTSDGPGIALGRPHNPGPAVVIPNDGSWHKVAIDLRELAALNSGNSLYVGFLRDAFAYPKTSIETTGCSFSGFSLVSSLPADALPLTQYPGAAWEARASAVRAAATGAASTDAATVLTEALADPEESVRLNALLALAANKAPGLEDKIAACMETVNPRIGEAAVAALGFQDTPDAWAILQRTLRVGPGTHTRVAAAGAIASRKDPASAGPIGALQVAAARDWHDRAATANALATSGTPQAFVFLVAFLDDTDPCVRATVVDLIPATDDEGLRRLMFLLVNDPSDAVRAAAAIKLLQAPAPDIKAKGYRGVRDDSWWVEVTVLDWIAAHPAADDRQALLQAITSPFGEVRSAALRALSTSTAPVTVAEISPVLQDLDPAVQRALIALANAKKLALPPASVAVLRASIDPDVASAAQTLTGS
ncbi:MAG: HEAT repeat domain-containing protein [Fimbriimonadaceae bacterium]